MPTLKDTYMPPAHTLREFLISQCPEKTDEQIIYDFTRSVARFIMDQPRMYRSYGAYWPAIKQMIVESGYTEALGTRIDVDISSIYSYSEPVLTCAAATLYHEHRIDQGLQYSTHHVLPIDATEVYELDYSDEELELKIAFS